MKRVVLDTNVLISATLWQNSNANKLLRKLIIFDVHIFVSKEILLEYQKVLKRDFNYPDNKISEIILKILSFSNFIEVNRELVVVEEDPDDNKILACALECSAEYLLTYDKHLLTIKNYESVKIIKPEDAIGLIN
jgi:uncharacterized protein